MISASSRCIGCDSERLRVLDSSAIPCGVASDSKIWPRSGTYVICEDCGHTQKILDDAWHADVSAIYGGYEMYYLAGGGEQQVFDGQQPMPRTKRLIERLAQCVSLPARGTMLDVGCAVGSTLRTFGSVFPEWALSGFDITTHSESLVRSIPGVTNFYTGSLENIDRQFDLITMLFVVEHLPDPRKVLREFQRLIKPNGVIWIHTSDFWANPFDLPVVDHSSHFMVDTLAELVERCGWTVIDRNDNWNIKETGVVAKLSSGRMNSTVDEVKKAQRLTGSPLRFHWLADVVQHSKATARDGKIAILGTSIAATWLANIIPDKLAAFVDEDPQRIGKTLLGRPVVKIDDVPANLPVYLAFPTPQAERIRERLAKRHPHVNLVVPPPLPT